MTLRVAGLYIYPLKSGAPVAVSSASLGPEGLAGDRRFVVTDPDGTFVTARTQPRLLDVDARLRADGTLALGAPGMPALEVAPGAAATSRATRIWGDRFDGLDCGKTPAQWLSDWLSRPVRLVYLPTPSPRHSEGQAPWGGGGLSAADGAPLLVACSASLADLNHRLAVPVPMLRFRPNIVIDGGQPYQEHEWSGLVQGGVRVELTWACTRCVMITLDETTRESHPSGEPLRTLLRYRRDADGRGIFGRNARMVRAGTLTAGEAIEPD